MKGLLNYKDIPLGKWDTRVIYSPTFYYQEGNDGEDFSFILKIDAGKFEVKQFKVLLACREMDYKDMAFIKMPIWMTDIIVPFFFDMVELGKMNIDYPMGIILLEYFYDILTRMDVEKSNRDIEPMLRNVYKVHAKQNGL